MHEKAKHRSKLGRVTTGNNGAKAHTGTALANYSDTISSQLALRSHSPAKAWGGARNRADRVSWNLTDRQVEALMVAARFAFANGWVFQRHWTIHYGKAGIAPSDGARFVSRVLDMVAKQARRDGGRMTAIWVRECASDKGEHVHILLHLPAVTALRNRTRRWIVAAGGNYRAGVCKVTIVGGRLSPKAEANEKQASNAHMVLRYLLKASSADTGEALLLTRAGKGGRITGKRCGWTQNIGASERCDRLDR